MVRNPPAQIGARCLAVKGRASSAATLDGVHAREQSELFRLVTAELRRKART